MTETANRVIQEGLARVAPESRRRPYRARTFSMGYPPSFDMDKALQFAAALEDEEIVRKLRLKK